MIQIRLTKLVKIEHVWRVLARDTLSNQILVSAAQREGSELGHTLRCGSGWRRQVQPVVLQILELRGHDTVERNNDR